MLVVGTTLLALVACLACVLGRRSGRGPFSGDGAPLGRPRPSSEVAWALAYLGAIATTWPLLRESRTWLGAHPLLIGDASSHAAIAREVARAGLPHGWIDVYNGGFPFGLHYPVVACLALAGLVRAGLSAAHAVQALGLAATMAVPLAAVHAARTIGARPLAALVGAAALAWVAPATTFVGGWETYFREGLVAQAAALPVAIVTLGYLAADGPRSRAPLASALLVATHPQIASATLAAVALPALVAGGRARGRLLRSAASTLALGAALYGPGLRSLGVPFGFPTTMPAWKKIGFPPDVLVEWWLEGTFLDRGRVAVLTALVLASVVALASMLPRRFPAAVLAAAASCLVLTFAGPALDALGAPGRAVLGFFMPLRVAAVLVIVAAGALVAAVEELATAFDSRRAVAALVAGAPLVALVLGAYPARSRFARDLAGLLEGMREGGGAECGPATPRGFETARIRAWLAEAPPGRFTFDALAPPMEFCPGVHGLELESEVPLGGAAGAGAHVGVNAVAFQALRPAERGSLARAESLGVRSLLHAREQRPPTDEGWTLVHESGDVGLSIRTTGTGIVGVGCIDEVWSGDDAALRAAIDADARGEARILDRPTSWVALERSRGPLVRRPADRAGCSPAGATVREVAREPGAYEAQISAASPADVIFRVTAWSGFVARVDGRVVATTPVAPGFFVTRVPAGTHRVEASAPAPTLYAGGVALALVAVGLVATLGGRKRSGLRRGRRRTRRSSSSWCRRRRRGARARA